MVFTITVKELKIVPGQLDSKTLLQRSVCSQHLNPPSTLSTPRLCCEFSKVRTIPKQIFVGYQSDLKQGMIEPTTEKLVAINTKTIHFLGNQFFPKKK